MPTLRDTIAAALARPDGPAPVLTPGPVALAPDGAGDPPADRETAAARRIDARDAPGTIDHGPDHPAAAPTPHPAAPQRFPLVITDPVPMIHAPARVLLAETRTIGAAVEYIGLDPSAAAGARIAYCVIQVTSTAGTVYLHAGRSALPSQRYPVAAGAGLALDGLGGLWLSSPDAATVSILVAGVGPGPR